MKTSLVCGMALGLASALPLNAAHAQSGSNPTGPYIGASLGYDLYQDDDAFDFDDGGSIGLQLGYRFSDNWRAELEGTATGLEIDGTDDDFLVIARGTFGLYYDFQSSDHLLVPYIGGALGIAGVGTDLDDVDDDDEDLESEFTWHAEAGLSLNLNPHFAIVPAYRYTWTDNSDNVTADNLEGHTFKVGARLSF